MKMNKFIYVLGLAPLLAGADTAQLQQDVVVNTLPACQSGQYLVYQGGGVTCQTIAGGSLMLPNCKGNGQILTSAGNGDAGGQLTCTAKGMPSLSGSDITLINTLETDIMTIKTDITQIQNNPPGAASVFVGETAAATLYNGTFAANGATGIRNAAAICAAQFGAGAHMCSVYDMYSSVVSAGQNPANKFNPAANLPQAWVYQMAWQQPLTTTTKNEPSAGLADNCASGQYGTADQGWKGTTVVWEPLQYNNQMALKFPGWGGGAVPCSSMLPIACCK